MKIRFLVFLLSLWLGVMLVPVARADAPVFAANAKSVNKSSSYLLDTVLYTIKLDNTAGTADALDVVFTDNLPRGVEVQLFSLDGIPQVLTLLTDGFYVGTIPAGTSRTVTILGVVTGIPVRPAVAQYDNAASWTYRYRPTPGAPRVNSSFTTNTVSTKMVRLETSMAIATVELAPILNLGTEITYTITVQNTGTLNSSGTTLTNLIPVGALYRAGSTRLNGVALPDIGIAGPYVLGGQINSPGRPAGQINIGETATISFKVTSLILPVVNVALVDADGPGPIAPLNVRGYVAPQSTDLSITKTDGVTSVSPGSETTYTITVRNNGTVAVTSVRVIDNLPLTLTNPAWVASAGTYNPTTGDWTGLNLSAGASVTLMVKARVSPLALGNIVNTVTVEPPDGVNDSNLANNSATDTDTLTLLADLGVTQVDGATSVTAGAPLSYIFKVSNAGPGAITSLTLTDTYSPSFLNPVFTPEQGVYNATTGAWTALNLGVGESVTMTLAGTLSLSASGNFTNTVTVAPPTGVLDLVPANNSATDTNSILPAKAPLVLVQSVDKTLAKTGEIITYTINYRNNSALPLPGVGIRSAIPEFTTFASAAYAPLPTSLTGCTLTQPAIGAGGTIVWNFSGVLAPGGNGTVSFRVQVK